ncbi:MAG TPA: hypothetical protein VE685_16060, partial [Thermoanaerobaculia bacterium]|nr:hypothetical protein [Thermoanaerobaculia bacterium]
MPDPQGDAPAIEGLPPGVAEAIAIANATSIGEQPAILANLALANQIANANLAQQYALANQQALFQVQLALVAKCVEVIARIDPTGSAVHEQLRAVTDLVTELMG